MPPKKRGGRIKDSTGLPLLVRAIKCDITDEERKSLFTSIRECISSKEGGDEDIYKTLSKVIISNRYGDKDRDRALQLMDYVMKRSKLFRAVVCRDIRNLLHNCCKGYETDAQKINKSSTALHLIGLIHDWDVCFGTHYPELKVLARYYRESVPVLNSDGVCAI